ncbi:hypothetical protein [Microvirga massiliensis]|uniref:hypothetical protein n=1 Tax=Microvirga massiliensis TaxID=1033741 RepID=UPI00062BF231|nr:hypothetical protein [Microvirga massiliensis]
MPKVTIIREVAHNDTAGTVFLGRLEGDLVIAVQSPQSTEAWIAFEIPREHAQAVDRYCACFADEIGTRDRSRAH